MTAFPYILAAGDDNPMKWVFPAIFILIWAVSSVINAIAKKKERERRERMRMELEKRSSAPPPVPLPTQRPEPIRRPMAKRPPPIPKKSATVIHRRTPKVTPRMPVPVPIEEPVVRVSAPAVTPVARRSTTATAATIHAWLKPATMRQQFILTEILRPPIAYRSGSEVNSE